MGSLNVQNSTDSTGSVVGLSINPQNIQILANGNVVGVVQNINPNEGRTATPIMGLGVEGVVTTAISNYSGGTFTTGLIAIYDLMPLESFGIVDVGGGVGGLAAQPRIKSLYQQRDPLDVRSITYTPNTGVQLVDTYRTCWITSYSKTIQTSQATVGINVGWRYQLLV